MGKYVVANNTDHDIWWKDGGWTSGLLPKGDVKTIESDHDADVTMFGVIAGKDVEYGRVWILRGCKLTVSGNKRWCLT